jgi:hydroxymethylpyrimidine/phosphomethylpyrimidine kinase
MISTPLSFAFHRISLAWRSGTPSTISAIALMLSYCKHFHGTAVHTSARRKVNDNIGVRVLLDGFFKRDVNGEKSFACSPIEFLDVVSTKGVNHSCHTRTCAFAAVIKAQHSLNGTWLEAVDEAAGSFVEGSVCGPGVFGAIDGIETNDNVVGLGHLHQHHLT